jgi:SAM-dependent methyltransferase
VTRESIDAYDVPDRVASYDADMEVMHPNRAKMVDVVVEFLPLPQDAETTVLDLGIGTGFMTGHLLEAYPRARVIGVDGAPAMIEMAKLRLGRMAERIDFRVGDFRSLGTLVGHDEIAAAVLTSYALHHLDRDAKTEVIRQAVDLLEPGGWFINADLILATSPGVEARTQQLRVEGIMRRAAPGDRRFADEEATRRFLRELEAEEGDRPVTLQQDLEIMTSAGLEEGCVLWLEYREAVTAGRKPI